MLRYEFYPEAKLLLINQSNEKVQMLYIDRTWPMPRIGPRPPYYCYPEYQLNYPVI
ncbi:hypothetical protein GJU40_03540 [Bacillus lacus]|uniref:Uncharacterized protein n=1 Tax=Metabacillus lacus TaxID=1983721 RepID=A0A7X2IX37_9BACI|nr:hypothetical protein [Metabacillus lacus]MRX71245.1 hypothetical protein [Metabacillus lacus]